MTKLNTTRRDFIKNSIITGAVTGSVIANAGQAVAKISSDIDRSASKNRVAPLLNQANMFDLPEAYALAWTQSVNPEGRIRL